MIILVAVYLTVAICTLVVLRAQALRDDPERARRGDEIVLAVVIATLWPGALAAAGIVVIWRAFDTALLWIVTPRPPTPPQEDPRATYRDPAVNPSASPRPAKTSTTR